MAGPTAELVSLPTRAQPNAELVADVEELLRLVKSGDVQALAFAAVRRDRVWMTGWRSTPGYYAVLGGAVLVLTHRFGGALLSNPEADPL